MLTDKVTMINGSCGEETRQKLAVGSQSNLNWRDKFIRFTAIEINKVYKNQRTTD